MRVVDVTSFFAEAAGGIRSYLSAKARLLPGAGVEHHIVVPGGRAGTQALGGASLHTVPGPRLGGSGYRAFADLPALSRLLRRLRPDVVEVGGSLVLPGLVRRAIAQLAPVPRLYAFYHSDVPATYVAPALQAAPSWARRAAVAVAWAHLRRQHAQVDGTLAASEVMRARLVEAGVRPVHLVGLGVDLERFRPAAERSDTPLCVYAGRLAKEKQIELLLDAWDEIHAATGAELALCGNGPLRERVRRFCAARPHARWLGVLPPERLSALLASAWLAVTPGAHESFSLATAEALACGTPVLCADGGGAGELCRRSGGGVAFAPGRAGDLAATAIALCTGPAAGRAALGRAGRAFAERELAWSRVIERLLAAYRGEAVAARRRRAA